MTRRQMKLRIIKLVDEVEDLRDKLSSSQNLFEEISNYSDVCEELGIDEKKESDFNSKKEFAIHQILNIEKLFNGDSKNNIWYPWFRITGSGLVFYSSYDVYDGYFGGQVAYYKDKATSDFIGNKFSTIYNNLK